MKLYRFTGNKFNHNGKVYKNGDIVELRYIPKSFKNLFEEYKNLFDDPVESEKEVEKIEEVDDPVELPKTLKMVPSDKKNRWDVVEVATGEKINEKPLVKLKAKQLIETLTEETVIEDE